MLRSFRPSHAFLAAAAVLAVSACDSPSGSPGPRATALVFPGGRALADSASVDVVFRVAVRTADGAAPSGLPVSFRSVGEATTEVRPMRGATGYQPAYTDTTDAAGEVRVLLDLHVAGEHRLAVRAGGLEDTVAFSITSGRAVSVPYGPRDTAVVPGVTFAVPVEARDRHQNLVRFTYEVARGPVTVTQQGAITATGVGRGIVLIRSVARVDSVGISVVPEGELAAQTFDPLSDQPTGLAVYALDGSRKRVLAPGFTARPGYKGLSWLADGSAVVVADEASVHLVDMDGRTRDVVRRPDPTSRLTGPRVSRDGAWIYFDDTTGRGTRIRRIRPDGTGESLPLGPAPAGAEYHAAPSPDGSRLAYITDAPACCLFRVSIRTLATGGSTQLADSAATVAWSPAGDVLAVAHGSSLWVVNADGTGKRVLGHEFPKTFWLDWSPDGRWLMLSSEARGVVLVDTATGDVLPLPFARYHGDAAWRPAPRAARR